MPTEYRTITEIAGPLIFVEKTEWGGYGELVEVGLPDGTRKRGQVLDSSKEIVVVQVFEGTAGIDRQSTVKFLGETGQQLTGWMGMPPLPKTTMN